MKNIYILFSLVLLILIMLFNINSTNIVLSEKDNQKISSDQPPNLLNTYEEKISTKETPKEDNQEKIINTKIRFCKVNRKELCLTKKFSTKKTKDKWDNKFNKADILWSPISAGLFLSDEEIKNKIIRQEEPRIGISEKEEYFDDICDTYQENCLNDENNFDNNIEYSNLLEYWTPEEIVDYLNKIYKLSSEQSNNILIELTDEFKNYKLITENREDSTF